jgi:hypothetical protein
MFMRLELYEVYAMHAADVREELHITKIPVVQTNVGPVYR